MARTRSKDPGSFLSQAKPPAAFAVDVAELRRVLRYDQETGVFQWLVRPARKIQVGDIAGCVDRGRGRRQIRIAGRNYYAHQLAWVFVHGVWPNGDVDHINGDPGDNRIANLRVVTHAINMQNRRHAALTNQTGLLGVSVCPSTGRFRARLAVGRKTHWLGRHDVAELAHAAYLAAKRRLHEGCTL